MREMQHHKKESWENPEDNNTKGKDLGGSKRNPYYQSNKDGVRLTALARGQETDTTIANIKVYLPEHII